MLPFQVSFCKWEKAPEGDRTEQIQHLVTINLYDSNISLDHVSLQSAQEKIVFLPNTKAWTSISKTLMTTLDIWGSPKDDCIFPKRMNLKANKKWQTFEFGNKGVSF